MKHWILIILLFTFNTSNAQYIRAFFLTDSLEIGKNIDLILVCEHDNTKELVFPSKTSNFSPFTFSNIEFYSTSFKNGTYIDSVKYQLKTFSVDSITSLRLYVSEYKTNKRFYSNTVSIPLRSSLKIADFKNPRLKPIINFYEVPLDTNYPKFVYIFLITGLICYLIWIFMGKMIIRNIQILLYKKKHRDFLGQFKGFIKNPNSLDSNKKALVLWKNHLQWLVKKPISTMTSSEIREELENERLGEALTYIDAAIFGGQERNQIKIAFDNLLANAHDSYRKQLSEYINKLKKK
jgi:hypothetical protein